MVSDWRAILLDAVRKTSVTDVARRMGVARSSVSLLVNGHYPGGTDRMAERVMQTLVEPCPVYGDARANGLCAQRRAAHMPTSNPFALRRWRACQQCNEWSEQ